MAMPSRRPALGELTESHFNYNAQCKPVNNAGFAKVSASSSHFKVPSSAFNFSSKIKRSFDEYDNEDQENVDPITLKGSAKKARGVDGEAVKPRHVVNFNLTTIKGDKVTESAKIARKTLGVKAKEASAKSPVASIAKIVKCPGIAARHRLGSKRIVRVEPHATNTEAPVSINAALAGTAQIMGSKTEQPTSMASIPPLNMAKANAARRAAKKQLGMGENGRKGHYFRIHEDTPDEEMAIVMEHHTNTLDISDDEGRGKYRDDDDKENVPPSGVPASAVRRVARKDMMTEEVRSPLGHLEASLYYAAGCDASSVINAPQEELPASDLVDFEFGSLEGELKEDIKSKLNEVEHAVVDHVAEESVAGGDAACNKSHII
ncbi:MAG: hypothetical protein L6R42_008136 [Xanthoria sp. 1 TBL-2021]|nr:MAG: hypothetical protein L6R42_008136 [Xanthoria sp. 1 TBL-2021]